MGVDEDSAAALPKLDVPGRGGLLADIQKGARLKKVSDQEKRDRSAAAVPGGEAAAPAPGGAGGGDAAAGGGLADALASALAARKSKVSHSGKCFVFVAVGVDVLTDFCLQMMRRVMMSGRLAV